MVKFYNYYFWTIMSTLFAIGTVYIFIKIDIRFSDVISSFKVACF